MTLRRALFSALTVALAITSTGLTARAQSNTQHELNLTDAQVYRIQALLLEQTNKISSLHSNVQSAHDALNAAVAKGDAVLTAMAVLSLDAAEKALKQTEIANQRQLLSILSESQKQAVVKDSSIKSIPASD